MIDRQFKTKLHFSEKKHDRFAEKWRIRLSLWMNTVLDSSNTYFDVRLNDISFLQIDREEKDTVFEKQKRIPLGPSTRYSCNAKFECWK